MKALTADTTRGIRHTPDMSHDDIMSQELFLACLKALKDGEEIKALVTDEVYAKLDEEYGIHE